MLDSVSLRGLSLLGWESQPFGDPRAEAQLGISSKFKRPGTRYVSCGIIRVFCPLRLILVLKSTQAHQHRTPRNIYGTGTISNLNARASKCQRVTEAAQLPLFGSCVPPQKRTRNPKHVDSVLLCIRIVCCAETCAVGTPNSSGGRALAFFLCVYLGSTPRYATELTLRTRQLQK